MTLFICAISYIYVVNGLKCHIVLGVCSIGIEGIVSYSVYVVFEQAPPMKDGAETTYDVYYSLTYA